MSGRNACDDARCVIEQKVQALIQRAARYYDMPFPPPVVLVDIPGADAGQALTDRNILRFNPAFYAGQPEHYLRYIVAHEVAHLITAQVYGRNVRPHGKEWRSVMQEVFEVPAQRCHQYDLTPTGRYPYLYRCRCRGRETPLSRIRHTRAQRGVVYICQMCKQKLEYVRCTAAGKTVEAPACRKRFTLFAG